VANTSNLDGAFVGRKTELDQWESVLADPCGQAVLVVGQQGYGKTWLLDRMAQCALLHPGLKCGAVRYEMTETQSPAVIMAAMIDDAFEAGDTTPGLLGSSPRGREQWRAFLNVFKIGDLVASLRRVPEKDTRKQLVSWVHRVAEELDDDGRAVFIIDPEKYMPPGSADDWRLVVQKLPDRIKLVFAQRPDGRLVTNADFLRLGKLVRIPSGDLDVLDAQAVDELIDLYAHETRHTPSELRAALAKYHAHPYAVHAALDLLREGTALNALPADPDGIAAEQWAKAGQKHGATGVKLLYAYATLEVPVPDELVVTVADIESAEQTALLADPFLAGMLRAEGVGRRIYHSLLSDHVRAELDAGPNEREKYHRRAVKEYRRRLAHAAETNTAPDALAAERLAPHVHAVDGDEAFIACFISECTPPLVTLGRFDAAIALSGRALSLTSPGSEDYVILSGNLGVIYQTRGDLDEAERWLRKALEIFEKLGRLEDMAIQYGNLGLIYRTRGDLDEAERWLRKELEIEEKLGRLEGMANAYGNLGLIYRTRGDLDEAERWHRKSLEIEEKLGRIEGMASDYGNLGGIYRTRGDLGEAERLHRKALEINEKLGRLEGMANQYGNLGLIYRTRGDLDEAERLHRKSLEIDEKLGRLEGMAIQYGNLGLIYRTRGDLDEAERLHRKSLEIFEKLGRLEGKANAYGNLGLIQEERGDLAGARGLWTKSRDLYARIGMPHMVARVQGWIDVLPKS
jgi:tetratricopeptide (TPR) repeat protein